MTVGWNVQEKCQVKLMNVHLLLEYVDDNA